MSELREAYKKWSGPLDEILLEPTIDDLTPLWPAFAGIIPEHTPKRPDGKPLTVGDYLDFVNNAYRAKQKREIIGLLMEAQKTELVIDHLLPRSHPGFNDTENIRFMHRKCHRRQAKWYRRLWWAVLRLIDYISFWRRRP